MTAEFGLLIMLLISGLLFLRGILSFVHTREYKRTRRAYATQAHWAEARNQLMRLVREEKLDVRSDTFRVLYGVQTFVLRRPDEYQEISRRLSEVFLVPVSAIGTAWVSEQDEWPEELQEVFKSMATGTGSLIMSHKGWRRIAVFLTRVIGWATLRRGRRLVEWLLSPVLVDHYLERIRLRMRQFA